MQPSSSLFNQAKNVFRPCWQAIRRSLNRSLILFYDLGPGFLFSIGRGYWRIEGCTIIVPLKFFSLSDRAGFFRGTWELEDRNAIKAFISPNDRVLELGACFGAVACITNKILSPAKSKHVVVEANPELISHIKKNRELNKCSFVIDSSAAGIDGKRIFYLSNRINASSLQRASDRPIEIITRSLQSYENQYGEFNVLVMDIEGGELEFISCSAETLKHYRLIILEWHELILGNENIQKCRRILKELKFESIERNGVIEVWEKPGSD